MYFFALAKTGFLNFPVFYGTSVFSFVFVLMVNQPLQWTFGRGKVFLVHFS